VYGAITVVASKVTSGETVRPNIATQKYPFKANIITVID
jgi:hypothetical protein